jgi:integrase
MVGAVRTKEKCPKCGGKYAGGPLRCPSCLTVPRRYFVDIFWPGQGRIKLYTDQQGYPLDSWERANRLLTAIRYEIDQGKFDPREYVKKEVRALRFENYVHCWLERMEARHGRNDVSWGYLQFAKGVVKKYLIPLLAGKDIRKIREGQIEDFRDALPSSLQPKTVANIMGLLGKILREAYYRRRDIAYLPKIPKIEVGEPVTQWISLEEQDAVLVHVPTQVFRTFFLLLMKQGVRPSEARALRWEDLDFKKDLVVIRAAMDGEKYRPRTKEKDIRYLPIHPRVRESLKKLPRSLDGYVFVHEGKPLSKKLVISAWNQAAREAGVKITCYQGTRHSLASQAINKGVSERIIGAMLGHKSVASTRRYAKLSTEALRAVWIEDESPGCPKKELDNS